MSAEIKAFVEAFNSNVLPAIIPNVAVRIFKYPGHQPGPQLTQHLLLASDPDIPDSKVYKPCSFFMQKDGVELMLKNGHSAVFETMMTLGLGLEGIRYDVEEKGFRYCAIVAPPDIIAPASWEGLFSMFSQKFPEINPYIQQYQKQCETETNFWWDTTSEFGQQFSSNYGTVDGMQQLDLVKDHRYLTPRRFLEETAKSFVDFRVLMWKWGQANPWFTGAGFTLDCTTGERGVSECLVPNQTIAELQENYGAQVLLLDVTLPPRHRGLEAEMPQHPSASAVFEDLDPESS